MALGLSPVGLGTYSFSNVFSPVSQETAHQIVEAHLETGGDYIETAPNYPVVDVNLGAILRSFPRAAFKIGTKCGIVDEGGRRVISGAYDFLRRQVEGELTRLGVDRLDLLQMHVPAPDVSPAAVGKTLSRFKAEGLVAAVGASNFRLKELRELCGEAEVEWLQIRFSMIHRSQYAEVLGFCQENRVSVNPYQVIERGQIVSADSTRRSPGDIRDRAPEYKGEAESLVRDWFRTLAGEAAQLGLPFESLAVAWAIRQPAIGCVVLGATTASQVAANWRAARQRLSDDDTYFIDAAFRRLEDLSLRLHGVDFSTLRGVM